MVVGIALQVHVGTCLSGLASCLLKGLFPLAGVFVLVSLILIAALFPCAQALIILPYLVVVVVAVMVQPIAACIVRLIAL